MLERNTYRHRNKANEYKRSDTQEALSYHFPNLTSSENVDLFICHPAGILRSWDTIIMGSASISLWAGSAFLLFLLVSAIGHYQLLTRSADTYSLKESGAMLKKQLERRINIDFIIYLIFFYGTAVRFVIQYFNDYEGLKGLTFILMLFTGILLAIPWLMRYQQKHRYRYYFNSLDKSQKLLEVSE